METIEAFFKNPIAVNETVFAIIAGLVVFDITWRAIKSAKKQRQK